MIPRTMKQKLLSLTQSFPAVAILGPRQAGKTTIAQTTLPDYFYVSLENYSEREFAETEPEFFLEKVEKYPGMIIDEVHNVPLFFLPFKRRWITPRRWDSSF